MTKSCVVGDPLGFILRLCIFAIANTKYYDKISAIQRFNGQVGQVSAVRLEPAACPLQRRFHRFPIAGLDFNRLTCAVCSDTKWVDNTAKKKQHIFLSLVPKDLVINPSCPLKIAPEKSTENLQTAIMVRSNALSENRGETLLQLGFSFSVRWHGPWWWKEHATAVCFNVPVSCHNYMTSKMKVN